MYETMEVYALSWTYYLSFIFFTAFAFLNMVIGIVVSALEKEQAKLLQDSDEETRSEIDHLRDDIAELKLLVQNFSKNNP